MFVWQVGIYVLEAGLGMPEFLSEGNSRLKKANQLMQKLLEYFYDFVIPGGCLLPLVATSTSSVTFQSSDSPSAVTV